MRYDAFGDMGGRLSFSAAIIDDEGTVSCCPDPRPRGVAHVRQGVVAGAADTTLTPEEQQALAAARTGKRNA